MKQTTLSFSQPKPVPTTKSQAKLQTQASNSEKKSSLKRSKPSDPIDPDFQKIEDKAFSKGLKRVMSNAGVLFDVKNVPKKETYPDIENIKKIPDEDFNPETDSPFTSSTFAPFCIITDTFDVLATIKGKKSQDRKKELISKLITCFIIHAPQELEELYLFCTRRMDSEYLQPDLGVGNETMIKASAEAVGMKSALFRKGVKKKGDLGAYVEEKKASQSSLGTYFGKKKKDEENTRFTVSILFLTFFLKFDFYHIFFFIANFNFQNKKKIKFPMKM